MPGFSKALGLVLSCAVVLGSGCGLFYQAATRMKASHMSDALKPGMTSLEVLKRFGQPDIRNRPDDRTSVWSYAYKPNSNDVTAFVLYTSAKEGDTGTFLDLKFVDGKLISWSEAEHTMPVKRGRTGLSFGVSGAGTSGTGTVHY